MKRELRLCHLVNVAGARHYDGFRLATLMGEGDPLQLLHEPTNPHDPDAIEVWWSGSPERGAPPTGGKLGYIPRPLNGIMGALQPILQGRWKWEARACGPACVFDLFLIQVGEDPWREAILQFLSNCTQDYDVDQRENGSIVQYWSFRAAHQAVGELCESAGFPSLEAALQELERDAIEKEPKK